MEWKEGEPMPEGLINHWNSAKRMLANFTKSKNVRNLIIGYLDKMKSFPVDEKKPESIYTRIILWSDGSEMGLKEAKEELIGDLFYLYEQSIMLGYEHDSDAPSHLGGERMRKLEAFDWEAEEAYWRSKTSRAQRKVEKVKQKRLDFPTQEKPEKPITENKKRTLKIRIGKRV